MLSQRMFDCQRKFKRKTKMATCVCIFKEYIFESSLVDFYMHLRVGAGRGTITEY
jgi:hypothetical protein